MNVANGPFEGGGQGGDGCSFQGGVDLPGALKGRSIDGIYAKENTVITVGSLSAQNCFKLPAASCLSPEHDKADLGRVLSGMRPISLKRLSASGGARKIKS